MAPCLHCGRTPAADVELRAHTGRFLTARRSILRGPLCKDCGLAQFRNRMDHTLVYGWWGLLAFFLNFWAMAKNLQSWARLRALHDPWGEPAQPLPPAGRPVYLRPAILVPVALFVLGGLLLGGSTGGPQQEAEDLVSTCVDVMTDGLDVVDCTEVHDGRVAAVMPAVEQCPVGTDDAVRLRQFRGSVVCVDLDS